MPFLWRKLVLLFVLACVTCVTAAGTANSADTADVPNLPPKNPWVANSAYAISHHNSAQTDVTSVAGPVIGGR